MPTLVRLLAAGCVIDASVPDSLATQQYRTGGGCPMYMPKSPQALIERFDTVAAEHPDATRRLTFGYPCLYVGGNMVSGLYGPHWHVKLGKTETAELMGMDGA